MTKTRQKKLRQTISQINLDEVIKKLKDLQPIKKNFYDQEKKNKYIQFYNEIKKTDNLNSLFELLDELLNQKLYPDVFVVSQLIQKINELKNIHYANAIYQDAIAKDIVNVVIHNSMIAAAGNNGDLNLAKEAYENATRVDGYVADSITYTNMIVAAGRNGDLAYAQAVYENAINRNDTDVFVHTAMIDVAGKYGDTKLAEKAYRNAINDKVANVVTHTTMINATGNNGNIRLAREAFDNATRKDCYIANVTTYSSMIDVAGKNRRIALAIKVYEEAINHHLANVVTHNSMINVAGICSNLGYAKKAYDNALKSNVADSITYTSMINAAGKNGDLAYAKEVYKNAINRNIANVFTHNAMINMAGINGDLAYAKKAFNNAINLNVDNVVTYSTMISAAGNNGDLAYAKAVYKNATSADHYIADAITYTNMIDTAGKNGNLQLAEEAYRNAIRHKVVNVIIHNSMIVAANKNDNIDLAMEAYRNATKANCYVADSLTHSSIIDALVQKGWIKQAEEIYKENGKTLPIIHPRNGYEVDLHGFSPGSVYIALRKFINETPKPFQITIIYGKGLHSKKMTGTDAPLKQSVNKLIEDIQKDYEIFFHENLKNSGRAFCKVQAKIREEKQQTKALYHSNQTMGLLFANNSTNHKGTFASKKRASNHHSFYKKENNLNLNQMSSASISGIKKGVSVIPPRKKNN